MIYFDNAATTFPKPDAVKRSVLSAFTKYGANPGRSGHDMSLKTGENIFTVREQVAELFGAEVENVVFTYNCTYALNFAIKGIMNNGGHIVTSDLEHNSVIRPIHALSTSKCSYSIAQVYENDQRTVQSFRSLITPQTKAIACTIASNVTGQILPYRQIGRLCKEHGICFIADGAQACGVLPINLEDDCINILCAPGHKGLYGPTGTGFMVSDGKFELSTLIEGGTGSSSFDIEQPDFLPDRFESGTVNVPGILGLGAGIRYVQSIGMEKIFIHELQLCKLLYERISGLEGVTLYMGILEGGKPSYVLRAPIIPFNLTTLSSEETTAMLNAEGFALRGGLHCAPLAHKKIGTLQRGAARFAPSAMNTQAQVHDLANAIRKIVIKTNKI